MTEPSEIRSFRVFRHAALVILAIAVLVVVSGVALTLEGRAALERSNAAFHSGRMRDSISFARQAALAYVPGSEHVNASYDRLEAIARGAESEGDERLARIAWDTLRVVIEQTHYLGRPPSSTLELAEENLARLKAAQGKQEP